MRSLGSVVALLGLLTAVPATAHAKTFYAAQADAGAGTCASPANACELDEALADAEATIVDPRDRVEVVGALTRTTKLVVTGPIDLVGSGSGAGGTFIDVTGSPALDLQDSASASKLRVRGDHLYAVFAQQPSTLSEVLIEGATTDGGGTGELLIEKSRLVTSAEGARPALDVLSSEVRVVDSTITGSTAAVRLTGPVLTVQRSVIESPQVGIAVDPASPAGSTLFVSSTLVRTTGASNATGLDIAATAADQTATARLRHVTVVENGGTADRGVVARTTGQATATVDVQMVGSIVRGFDQDLSTSGPGAAKITAGTSDYATTAGTIDATTLGGNVDVDPQFESNNGDFRLKRSSPLIDAAGTAPIAAQESATDLLGADRIRDGNGDGTAARDMGAYELAPPDAPGGGGTSDTRDLVAPVLTDVAFRDARMRIARADGTGIVRAVGTPAGSLLRYTLSESANVTFTVLRNGQAVGTFTRPSTAGANEVVFTGRIDGKALRLGRHEIRLVATDAAGNASAAATATIEIVRFSFSGKPRQRSLKTTRLTGGLLVAFKCSDQCDISGTLKLGKRTIARGKGRGSAGRTARVRMKLTRGGRRALRGKRRVQLVLRGTAVDDGGNRRSFTRRVVLR